MSKSPVGKEQKYLQLGNEVAKDITLRLLEYCRLNEWSGYDPYDALNSRVLRVMPFLNFKMARLLLTQAVKRSPINLRPLLLVPKSPNPKGIALFLSSIIKLTKIGVINNGQEIRALAEMVLALRSPGERYWCWGYNFDWQTRREFVPRGSPNIICTTFAANALLDAYEQSLDSSWLEAAVSAADFILDVLYWRESGSEVYFSYTPLRRSEIHNASLLGAAFLCRIGRISGQKRFIEPAINAARFSVSKQHEDGSWDYGESTYLRWVDNFHTGYNLLALKRIKEYGEIAEFDAAIRRGHEFYIAHFFGEDGAPRYFHNATYPLDIHSASQSIITLVELREFAEGNLQLAWSVLGWAIAKMWDPRGFFYFQRYPYYTVRIPYMRWSQAWMLLALSYLVEAKQY